MKNPLIINLKGKLQKPFDFFLRCQTCRRIWLVHLLVEVPRRFELLSDNRSQQHVEAIHETFDFISPTRTS